MTSQLPASLHTVLPDVVVYMQRGISGEVPGSGTDRYSDLLRTNKNAVLAFLAEHMERQTNGCFSVREASFALLRAYAVFTGPPALCLAVCRPTRRPGATVTVLGDEDELYFIPPQSELSDRLAICKVDRP